MCTCITGLLIRTTDFYDIEEGMCTLYNRAIDKND